MKGKNKIVLEKIIRYCYEIQETIRRFDLDYDKFEADFVARNAISMCILQVGELSKNLTEEFRQENDKAPWKNIIGMRNRAAHKYGEMDKSILWHVASQNIPTLKLYCEEILTRTKE